MGAKLLVQLPNSSRYLALIFARTMRKIKAKNVNTSTSERLQLVFRLAVGPTVANNLVFLIMSTSSRMCRHSLGLRSAR